MSGGPPPAAAPPAGQAAAPSSSTSAPVSNTARFSAHLTSDAGGAAKSSAPLELSAPLSERRRGGTDVETVLNRSLRNENDLLRCQLNDLIAREKSQRVELQRLRQDRDAEVTSMVQSATSQLKAEVEQLKSVLQNTSGQLLQALSEREQARNQKDQCVRMMEERHQAAMAKEGSFTKQLQMTEEAVKTGLAMAASLADSVDAFQRHVLPTFKPTGFEINKPSSSSLNSSSSSLSLSADREASSSATTAPPPPEMPPESKALLEQLVRLENGLALLRVIVDAKNDTLVLIRGKLKQENDELRSELQVFQEKKKSSHAQSQQQQQQPAAVSNNNNNNGKASHHHRRHDDRDDDDDADEKAQLQQELQSLQALFKEEVSVLKSKLKAYESEEQEGQGRLMEVQRELLMLQNKLNHVEATRSSLEANLKEETAARSQLVSQLFALRKDNEKTKAELETLKLSQKFLVRQPRNGRIPVEKMDLMNTVNQLLTELDKIKGEKVALEEELKAQKLSHVRDRIQRTVTSRDVEMAASNKVGDSELASKLARARLQQLTSQQETNNSSMNSRVTPTSTIHDGFSHSSVKPSNSYNIDLQNDYLSSGLQNAKNVDVPFREEIMNCAALYANSLPTKVV